MLLLHSPARGAEPATIADCEARLAAQPEERATALCFYELATGEGDAGPATEVIEEIASRGPRLPWFSLYLGHIYYWTRAAEAERLYHQAAVGFHRDESEKGEILARLNLHSLLTRAGRMEEAGLEVERILEITRPSGEPEIRVWGQLTLARHLFNAGEDLDRAYEILRTLEIPRADNDEFSMRRDRIFFLGNVCMTIGRFGEARDAYRELLKIALSKGDRNLEATSRYNLALVAYERLREAPVESRREEVIALAKEAKAVAAEAGNRSMEAMSSWMLGALIPGEEGRRFLEHCYQVAESPDLKSLCLNPLAGRLAATDPGEARRMLSTSRRLAEQSGHEWAEVRVWQEALRVDWAALPPEQATEACWKNLEAIESLRDRQASGSSAQAGLFSVWSDDYAWLVGRLLEPSGGASNRARATSESFRVSERRRARALTDWLNKTDAQPQAVAASDSLGLEEVQASLDPDEALLSFQVAPWHDFLGQFAGGSWLLAVTRDAVTVHRLPGRVELRRSVDLFDGLIERRDGSEARVAARLYEQLLAPALAELPPEVDRLILVPDDALHRLPFSALRTSVEAEPLGSRYELVRVPSATLWLGWREVPVADPARPLLVLADPDSPLAGEAAADAVVAQGLDRPPAQVRNAALGLGRLPHARREGRAAVRALGEGLLLVGAEASEARLGALPLGEFGLLHFAAHAVTDEDRPERSAVLLTPGGGHDGLLESAEIAGLDLSGRTVVLASCRSASGTVLRGEGVMSLGRAFFQAGAHGVVASLWPLRDDESEALFGRVYRHLGRGASVGEALHRARREAIEAGEPAAAWAGLVMLGDGATVPLPGGGSTSPRLRGGWLALWVLLAVALAAGAAAAWRLRAGAG